MSPSEDAAIEPLDVDGVKATVAGTLIWAVALVYCLVRREELVADGRGWWLWSSVAGIVIGLLGAAFSLRRRAAYRAAAAGRSA